MAQAVQEDLEAVEVSEAEAQVETLSRPFECFLDKIWAAAEALAEVWVVVEVDLEAWAAAWAEEEVEERTCTPEALAYQNYELTSFQIVAPSISGLWSSMLLGKNEDGSRGNHFDL